MGFIRGSASQPSLQEYGGRAGILGLRAPGSARQLRREAFVVDLNRHVEPIPQPLDECAGLPRLVRVGSGQRQRQPDEHQVRLELADQRDEPPEAAAGRGREDRVERGGQGAGRIGDRDPAARAAVVQRDDAAQASACRTASSAARSASGSLSGSRPPAWAIVSRPPPPPPTTCAAALTIVPARTPRSTAPGLADTSSDTRPPAALPSTTTDGSPSRPRNLSAASGIALGSSNAACSTSTLTPPTSTAASGETLTASVPPALTRFSSSRR